MNTIIQSIPFSSLSLTAVASFAGEFQTDLGAPSSRKEITNLALRSLQNISASLIMVKAFSFIGPTALLVGSGVALFIVAAPLAGRFVHRLEGYEKIKKIAYIIDISLDILSKSINSFATIILITSTLNMSERGNNFLITMGLTFSLSFIYCITKNPNRHMYRLFQNYIPGQTTIDDMGELFLRGLQIHNGHIYR